MKKILLGLAFMLTTLAFVGCSSDNDDAIPDEPKVPELTINRSEISLFAKGTESLSSNLGVIWESENDFIASVNEVGLVTGNHVGKTKIKATYEDKTKECEVEVKPTYSLYINDVYATGLDVWKAVIAGTLQSQMYNYIDSKTYPVHDEINEIKASGYSVSIYFKPEMASKVLDFITDNYVISGKSGTIYSYVDKPTTVMITVTGYSPYVNSRLLLSGNQSFIIHYNLSLLNSN